MYAFLFDRRSLTLLIVGVFALGALLFFGGMMIGMGVEHDRTRSVAAPDPTPVSAAAGEGFEPGVEPIQWRASDSPSVGDVPPPPTSAPPPPAPATTPPPPPAPPPPAAPSPSPSPVSPPSSPPPSSPPPSSPSLASTSGASTSSGTTYWTVQVGAFQSKELAQDRLTAVVAAGWTEFELETSVDAGGTTWYKVRWGCWPRARAAAEMQDVLESVGGEVSVQALPAGTVPPSDAAASDDADLSTAEVSAADPDPGADEAKGSG